MAFLGSTNVYTDKRERNEIIFKIYEYLDKNQKVGFINSFEKNHELKEYVSLTLVEM